MNAKELYTEQHEQRYPTNLFLSIDAVASICFENIRHKDDFQRMVAFSGQNWDWSVGL